METELSGFIDWQEKQLLIENKTIEVDEYGAFNINVSEILLKDSPMTVFEGGIGEVFTNEELITLNTIWGSSRTITIKETAELLNKPKDMIKEIITLGLKHGVLVKWWNNAWKISSNVIRERMLSNAKRLMERRTMKDLDKGIPMTEAENLKRSRDRSNEELVQFRKSLNLKRNENEEEEIHNPDTDESVKDVLNKQSHSSQLGIQRTIEPPKKKPLPHSSVTMRQKPRKPLK